MTNATDYHGLALGELTVRACSLVRQVGRFLHNEISQLHIGDIQEKGRHDFVTRVDRQSERLLVEGLSALLPSSGFLAEEEVKNHSTHSLFWIIDPLDGTTNFIHGVPLYAISVALFNNNRVVAGIVYEVNLDECFYSWEGGPVVLNESVIKVSEVSDLGRSLFATGFPYYDYSKLDQYMRVFDRLLRESSGLRRLGSAAVDLAYVACGRFEGFYEYGLQPWDVAAGAFLVQQAGGRVCDFKEGNDYIYGKELVATNGRVHVPLMAIIKECFNEYNYEDC